MGPRRVEVRIAGTLPIMWPERFASSLVPRAIRMARGDAERRGESWTGFFELEAPESEGDPADFDYPGMLQSIPVPRQSRPIAILHYGLVRLPNALRLAIQADDRQGLLADALVRLKHLGLYPRRLTVDTALGLVTQCFWLTGYGEREPDVQTERELRALLVTSRKLRRSR